MWAKTDKNVVQKLLLDICCDLCRSGLVHKRCKYITGPFHIHCHSPRCIRVTEAVLSDNQ
jgi:hypothetical protein